MWVQLRSSAHRGHWRTAHPYRTPGERASNILWWTVIGTTLIAATVYVIRLFQ